MKPNFITEIIDQDNLTGRFGGKVHTRFPPEPNGYLHIGHVKAIFLNYSIAKKYGGKFNLRFDDTNPCKEEQEYVDAIIKDVSWLGVDWEDRIYYASDYFEKMFEYAIKLIKKGKAYVCDLSPEEISKTRGTLTEAGIESPYRNRSVVENLDLFWRMRKGEFAAGSKTLRAKIDMAHPNLNMRDPVMYRIIYASHHRTKDKWCIYPTYDWAHPIEDAIEGITHSICTLEFENHRLLYDWFLNELEIHHPQQIEFARLNLSHTVLSKRLLIELVQKKYVDGWDDPRLPTIAGLRRRGYTPESLRKFCEIIGVSKTESIVDLAVLENCIREELNKTAQRVMAVLKPIKLIIDNYPANLVEELDAINNPEDLSSGVRKIPFSNELYIEEDDFRENPPKEFFRLAPKREVRLKYAYFVTCTSVVKDNDGRIKEIHCIYDPATKGGGAANGRKVKGTIHWVSAKHSIDATVNLYDTLFTKRNPQEDEDFLKNLNSRSKEIFINCKVESSLKNAKVGDRYQFERLGYFIVDGICEDTGNLIFNRIVTLKDSWAKIESKLKS
ncbi:MAG: glutamine--tRNA ligase/YqeY domain fusion protein [Candidatus Omnitrophica bacterium]|nr:glutamine--tRNA ligase/YqeY domain fusion protein [Candidatus Omnitrophota bacterium]